MQLTWRDNYKKATQKLGLNAGDDLEWHADRALDLEIASDIMFRGMVEGWFRTKDNKPETLPRYFNSTVNDPYNARGIINGDKTKVPQWSGGVSIGALIATDHKAFLMAFKRRRAIWWQGGNHMSIGGILLGLINIGIVVAILLLIGVIAVWILGWLGVALPNEARKIYIVIVALIALYMIVALLLGLPGVSVLPIR